MRVPARPWLFLLSLLLAVVSQGSGVAPIDIPIQPASYGTAFFQETGDLLTREHGGPVYRLSGDPRVHDKVRIRVMAGEEPDATDAVLQYDALIGAGKIVDLTPFLDGPNWEGTGRWRDDFLPGVLERWTREQKVYGIPFAYAAWVVFYDEALFEKHGWVPPETWDEFFKLCDAMKADGVVPLALPGVYMRYADAFLRAAYYDQTGERGYKAYQQLEPGIFSAEPFQKAAETTQRIARDYLLAGWLGLTHTASQQAFLEGKTAMTLSGSWFVSEMRGKIPASFKLRAFNLPSFQPHPGSSGVVQGQSAYYFLFQKNDPQRLKQTVDYFRFLTSRTRVQAFVKTLDSPVALKAVRASDFTSPAMQQVAAMISGASAIFDSAPPPNPAFLSFTASGLNGERWKLLTQGHTPLQFGVRLEQAAAAERARLHNPGAISIRHGTESLVLLVVLAALLVWLVARKRRKASAGVAPGRHVTGRVALGFMGPALLLFAVFVLLPSLISFGWAFFHWDGFNPRTWAGLSNFEWLLLESDGFWHGLKNNFYLMVVPTLLVVPTALLMAALVHRGIWGAKVFRAVVLFPNLLGGIAATLLWMNAYAPHGGLVNAALVHLGDWTHLAWLKSFSGYAWLSQDNLYKSLVPIYLWMACGFNMVLYLAAMQGVDKELYEAAEIDGASPLSQFFKITLPLIWDVLAVSAVFIVVAGLNTFEMIWLLTSQDPGTYTHVLSTLMVSSMFTEFQIGRATAIAVVMFLLVMIGSLSVLRLMGSKEEPT